MRFSLGVFLIFLSTAAVAKDCVVLLHGLARTDESMMNLDFALEQAGYDTVSTDYPSTDHSIATLATAVPVGAQ